jgi:hypothetical protein
MSTHRIVAVRSIITATVAIVTALAAGVAAQTNMPAVRYTATAINTDPSVRLTATTVDLTVTRWSTDAEREKLLSLVTESGQDKLLKALQAMPKVGTIKTPDSLSYDLHYARRTPGDDGGERIVLTTDRIISFWEAANMSRTMDYPFMVIELRLNTGGQGEGKITVATKIFSDPKTKQIVLENYGSQPVRLTKVTRQGK